MFEVIAASDMVLLLISDAAQAALHEQIFEALRPGAPGHRVIDGRFVHYPKWDSAHAA